MPQELSQRSGILDLDRPWRLRTPNHRSRATASTSGVRHGFRSCAATAWCTAGATGWRRTRSPGNRRAISRSGPASAGCCGPGGLWLPLCLWLLVHDAWGWAAGTGAMALVSYLITPSEFPPRYGLDHEFSVDDEEFLPTMAGATGVPFAARKPHRHPEQRRRSSTRRCSRRSSDAEVSITIEAYIYWAGDIGRQFAEALAAKAAAGLRVKILLDAVGSTSIGEEILQMLEGRRLPARLVQPDPLLQPRALQPSHPPQVADPRRPHRFHRRRRHRRPLARRRAQSERVARHANPHRGPGGDPAADRLRAQLAADDRRADLGTAVLSARRTRPDRWRRRRS